MYNKVWSRSIRISEGLLYPHICGILTVYEKAMHTCEAVDRHWL